MYNHQRLEIYTLTIMKKPRAEHLAWKKLVLAQINTCEHGIKCLSAELRATRELLRCQKRALAAGCRDEAKLS